jgi:hypothetical protein
VKRQHLPALFGLSSSFFFPPPHPFISPMPPSSTVWLIVGFLLKPSFPAAVFVQNQVAFAPLAPKPAIFSTVCVCVEKYQYTGSFVKLPEYWYFSTAVYAAIVFYNNLRSYSPRVICFIFLTLLPPSLS